MVSSRLGFDMLEQICNAGLYLVPIPPDKNGNLTKAPCIKGWNQPRSQSNPNGYSNNAADFVSCQGFNFGLYHGASNTLALDLDDMELARQVFEDTTDFDLIAWLENEVRVEIKSPKANRGKLLFKVPAGFSGSLKQLKKPNKDNPKIFDVVFELRCGNCQDVIYGQHPEGGNYQLIGDPAAIPEAPPVLLDMLQNWDEWKPCFNSALGIETEPPKYKEHKSQLGEDLPGLRNPITEFNQAFSVHCVLYWLGYKAVGRDRFIRPGSTSKAPGVVIMRNCADGVERVFSHGGDVLNDGYAHDAFDCYRLLYCDGKW